MIGSKFSALQPILFKSYAEKETFLHLSLYLLSVLVGVLCCIQPLQASDYEREKWLAEQLKDQITDGESVVLPLPSQNGESQSFYAIYNPAKTRFKRGSAILLHGWNSHPAQYAVVHPLRTQLTYSGWNTLSIQLPLPTTKNVSPEEKTELLMLAIPRIDAALDYLKGKKEKYVVLIGHSFGAMQVMQYLKKHGRKSRRSPISAMVVIGTWSEKGEDNPFNIIPELEKNNFPLLDIFGDRDLLKVRSSASRRKAAASANPEYRQVEINGADHFFSGLDDELVYYLRGWLRQYGSPVP